MTIGDGFSFWVGKILAELMVPAGIVTMIFLVWLVYAFHVALKK